MKQPEDFVWESIINSAKTKFDYEGFRKRIGALTNDRIPENILFQVLVGFVEKLTNEEIASRVSEDLLLLGFSFDADDFEGFLSDKKQVLEKEIQASDMALSLLAQGKAFSGVLVEIERLLSSE